MDAWRATVRAPPAPSPEPTPRTASLARPAVQTTEPASTRGEAGGQTITGRQRHVRVETVGLWGVVVVSRAAMADAAAAPQVLKPWGPATAPRWAVIWADRTYPQHCRTRWIATASPGNGPWAVGRRPAGSRGFVLLPQRWVVERTLAGPLSSSPQG